MHVVDPSTRSNEAGEEARKRILVVDDHDLFRVGLVTALSEYDDIEVVAQASGGKMAVRLACELRPDVVLMDLRLPDLTGAEATRSILAQVPSVRIVMLTVIVDESEVADAVGAGACGYVLKDSTIEDVVAATRAAASETAWLSPRAAQALLDHLRRDQTRPDHTIGLASALSPRECEVLRLIARGLENSEIAAEMSISPRTVKNHVSSILGKLGVSNRIQAAVYAVQHGIA